MLYPVDSSSMFLDDWIGVVLGALFAITLNAEAQAFVSTLLGDCRTDAKDRFHFNPALHIDLLGAATFLVAGFGWPRRMDVNSSCFKRRRLYGIITRFSGPLANLLLASIMSSLAGIMDQAFAIHPKIFNIVIGVNLAFAVFNLLPIPPLAGFSLISAFLPDKKEGLSEKLWKAGPYVLLLLAAMDRLLHLGVVQSIFRVMVSPAFQFFTAVPPAP